MLGAFAAFIIMGIIGGTAEVRGVVIPIIFAIFCAGLACFWYSKWIEQPGIKQGAVLCKKLIDEEINPRYADSQYRIRWTVSIVYFFKNCYASFIISIIIYYKYIYSNFMVFILYFIMPLSHI